MSRRFSSIPAKKLGQGGNPFDPPLPSGLSYQLQTWWQGHENKTNINFVVFEWEIEKRTQSPWLSSFSSLPSPPPARYRLSQLSVCELWHLRPNGQDDLSYCQHVHKLKLYIRCRYLCIYCRYYVSSWNAHHLFQTMEFYQFSILN